MRTRKEILDDEVMLIDMKCDNSNLILEVLLDIRDELFVKK